MSSINDEPEKAGADTTATPPNLQSVTRLDLRHFNVGDVASTFLYASAINTVMAKAADEGGNGVYIGAAFVVILLLDWLSRVYLLTNFPSDDQVFRGSSWLLILKVGVECVCVTLITTVAVIMIGGDYEEELLSQLLLAMFGVFLVWNYLMVGVLKHVDFRDIIRAVFQGYDGASGVYGNYLRYFAALLREIREEATPSNSRVLGAGLKMTGAMLIVLFLCAHILAAPWVYALFAVAEVYNLAMIDVTRMTIDGWTVYLIWSICGLAFFSAVFAANAKGPPDNSELPSRTNLGSVVCFLSILTLMFLIALYVSLYALLWIWFIQVSCASFLVFFMSQERVPPFDVSSRSCTPTPDASRKVA